MGLGTEAFGQISQSSLSARVTRHHLELLYMWHSLVYQLTKLGKPAGSSDTESFTS